MSKQDNGGPAFPSHGSMGEVTHEGMDLRDYFAAKAMQGMLASPEIYHALDDFRGVVARESYKHADAMLKARNQ